MGWFAPAPTVSHAWVNPPSSAFASVESVCMDFPVGFLALFASSLKDNDVIFGN
jgi:hypothetical protein